MKNKSRKILSLMLVATMLCTVTGGCGKKGTEKKDEEPKGKPTVITIGTHSIPQAYQKDDLNKDNSGRSTHDNSVLAGLAACKDENIELRFKKYSTNATQDILKSVLANDPMCDIALLAWGYGIVLSQNVIQPLDAYEDMFKDPEYQWMYLDKMYGHHYFLNETMDFMKSQGLVYNINYVKKVETLKENGKVVLPTELWKQGKWTWSAFRDYLDKVQTYYQNKMAPGESDIPIVAYKTDVLQPAIQAVASTGEKIYSNSEMHVDSDDTKRAIDYVDSLYQEGLITQTEANKNIPLDFKDGKTVFTNLSGWSQPTAAQGLIARGEAMGVVPFPRPDDINADDAKYSQASLNGTVISIPKGLSKERTDLAVKAFRTYAYNYMKTYLNTDSIAKCTNDREIIKQQALIHNFDVVSEEYGDIMVDAYGAYNKKFKVTELYGLTNWVYDWNNVVKNSILGLNSSPKYEAAIAAQKNLIDEKNSTITSLLSSEKVKDNISPNITLVDKAIAFAKGQEAGKIDWSKYIKATDNIDGDIDIGKVTIDTSIIKFDTVGNYAKGLAATVKDKEGNEKKASFDVIVYDPDNKQAPTLVAKEKYREVKLNEDVSKINWGKDFVENAQSADGFDIKGAVTADVSSLDVTKSGKYDVTLTATDYVGNKTELKISVTVATK